MFFIFQFVFNHYPDLKRVMIVDLDAHQGNGHERDFIGDNSVCIMDVYNKYIYPGDQYAKNGITRYIIAFI